MRTSTHHMDSNILIILFFFFLKQLLMVIIFQLIKDQLLLSKLDTQLGNLKPAEQPFPPAGLLNHLLPLVWNWLFFVLLKAYCCHTNWISTMFLFQKIWTIWHPIQFHFMEVEIYNKALHLLCKYTYRMAMENYVSQKKKMQTWKAKGNHTQQLNIT